MTDEEPAWGTSGPDNAPPWARKYYDQQAGALDDEAVAGLVVAALESDPSIPPESEIEVLADDGTITLEGRVPGEQVRERAERDARAIDGVLEVVNRLQVGA